jgi:hypothetical protein
VRPNKSAPFPPYTKAKKMLHTRPVQLPRSNQPSQQKYFPDQSLFGDALKNDFAMEPKHETNEFLLL